MSAYYFQLLRVILTFSSRRSAATNCEVWNGCSYLVDAAEPELYHIDKDL